MKKKTLSINKSEAEALIYVLMEKLLKYTHDEVNTLFPFRDKTKYEAAEGLRDILRKLIALCKPHFSYSEYIMCGLLDKVSPKTLKEIATRSTDRDTSVRQTALYFLSKGKNKRPY